MLMGKSCLLAAAVLALPLTAHADCAERIAAVAGHPAVAGASGDGGGPEGAADAGRSLRDDGGETTHQQGGPATPSESWFTDSEDDDRSSVLTHLDTARDAQEAGNERACLEAVEQAEAALRDD